MSEHIFSDEEQKIVDMLLLNPSTAAVIDKMAEERGWTPPPKKQPEFKPGDYVESGLAKEETIFVVKEVVDGKVWLTNDSYIPIEYCRHADTWINWEAGPVHRTGYVILQWKVSKGYAIYKDYKAGAISVLRWAHLNFGDE